jgi:hypothetical protein
MSNSASHKFPQYIGTTAVASLFGGKCGDPAAVAERAMGLEQYIKDGLRTFAPYDVVVGPSLLLMEGQGYLFGTWGRPVSNSVEVIGFTGGAEECDRGLVQAYDLLQRNTGPDGPNGGGGG